MDQPLPPQFTRLTLQKRPPEGAVGRCPAAQERLDSGQEEAPDLIPGPATFKILMAICLEVYQPSVVWHTA
jgi:hypothetical protein